MGWAYQPANAALGISGAIRREAPALTCKTKQRHKTCNIMTFLTCAGLLEIQV